MLNCQVLIEKLPQIKEKQKHLLVENELKKMRLYNWEYSIGKITFEEDGNYLVFQPINRYLLVMIVTLITGNLKDCLTK